MLTDLKTPVSLALALLSLAGCCKSNEEAPAGGPTASARATATPAAKTATRAAAAAPQRACSRAPADWKPGRGGLDVRKLGTHADAACSAAFSPDGSLLVTGSFDGTVKLWDPHCAEEVASIRAHDKDETCAAAFAPDGKSFATGSWDHSVKIWDTASRSLLRTLKVDGGVKAVAFSPDGATVAAATLDGKVSLFQASTGALSSTLTGPSKGITSVAYSRDGSSLASASYDGSVRLYSTAQLAAAPRMFTDAGAELFGVAFSPDGRTLLAAGGGPRKNHIAVFPVDGGGAPARTLDGPSQFVYSVAASPSGKLVAAAGLDARVRVWDIAQSKPSYTIEEGSERVHAVAFSPDGKSLAAVSGQGKMGGIAGKDNSVRLYRLP